MRVLNACPTKNLHIRAVFNALELIIQEQKCNKADLLHKIKYNVYFSQRFCSLDISGGSLPHNEVGVCVCVCVAQAAV